MLAGLGGFCASAEASFSSEVLLDLQGFGIVHGDENGNLNLEDGVTRAEFCKMVAVMISGGYVPSGFDARFADVGKDHWAYDYINMAAAYGLISGTDKYSFTPDSGITFEQAMKVLVNALGYENMAEAAGGYPAGYTVTGISLGINKNVSASGSEPLVRADVMTMIYNCLDVCLMEAVLNQPGDYIIGSDTYRAILSGTGERGIMELTGVVTANYHSYIGTPNADIEPNQIELFGTLIDVGNTTAYDLLGQEVSAFVSYGKSKTSYVLASVMPTTQNTVIRLSLDDIESMTSGEIVYDKDGEEEVAALDSAVFVYNGSPARLSDIKPKLGAGSATLISNDGNKSIDVVIIESYTSGVAESVDAEHEYITLRGQGIGGLKKIFASTDYENDYYTQILNQDGESVGLDAFSADDVLSLFVDNDGTVKKIVGCNAQAEGTVDEFDASRFVITIDGNEYKAEKQLDFGSLLGKDVTAWLNFDGRIAQIEEKKGERNFGVIVGVTSKGGMSEKVMVKMLLPNPLAEQVEENEDPTADVTKALVARNSEVAVLDVAESFRINNERYGVGEIYAAISRAIRNTGKGYLAVEYTLNSDGELRSVKDPEEIGTMTTKTYNSKEKTFGKTIEGSAFGINENTLSVCVPRNDISSDNDYLAYISMSNGRSYRVSAFEYNESTYCADFIVVNETMTYETTGSITKASKAGVVLEVKNILDDDVFTRVVMLTENGKEEFTVSDHTGSTADFSSLKKGDLIYYSLDSANFMDGFSLISHSNPLPETGAVSGDNAVYVGYVDCVKYNVVSNSLNCWVDTLHFVDDAGNTNTFDIRKTSTPPIYIYDSQAKLAERATTSDLLRAHKRVVVAISGQTVRAVLLIV